MINMLVKEKVKIHTVYYPDFARLNPILHRMIVAVSSTRNMGAMMTDWKCNIDEFRVIADYVGDTIPDLESAYRCEYPLQLGDLWGQWYKKGDYQISHTHLPNHWSFVYYVNTPRGSSPMIFTDGGKRIKAEAGKIAIFPAFLRHHVPKNNCDGRSVISGNFFYNRNDAL